jgi:predicted O-linked N-acetylglucosamine transferase (SPINDLY family)
VTEANLAEAWRLHRAGEHDKAALLYLEVLRDDPKNYEALHRLAFLCGQLGRWEDAQSLMAHAIALNPRAPGSFFLRGSALQKLNRHDEAVACFDRALGLNPRIPEVRLNRAASLYRLRRYEEAGEDYGRLLDIASDFPFARGNRLFCRLQCCDWRSLETEASEITAEMRAGRRVIAPFDAKALFLSAEDELACARAWAANQHPGPTAPSPPRGQPRHTVLRIAYISADFREGPLATLMTGVLEHHDRRLIETVGVSLGADDGSAARRRFERAFHRFVDMSDKNDAEITSVLREMQIDIAVDLMGFTEGGRPGIFKLRPAPIQVGYLGYPGTVGGDWLDYLIADPVVVPDEHRRFYAEQLVYLPVSFLPRDTGCKPSTVSIARADEGLAEQGFVFACFNNAYKLNPAMFDIWMRLLHKVEGSVLWLSAANPAARQNLLREAQTRGIASERLVFARFKPSPEEHLARLKLADLFLDTLPYNAHTTASDALWAGLPVLTCVGNTFAGRVAASLLAAIGLPEVITTTLDEYESRALQLARDPGALAAITKKLRDNRDTCLLFDTARFTRHLEGAYAQMWTRADQGAPPHHFTVPRLS